MVFDPFSDTHEIGHSKRKQSDSFDNDTSTGLGSDDKEEEIQGVARKEQKLFKSSLGDFIGSIKEEVAAAICSSLETSRRVEELVLTISQSLKQLKEEQELTKSQLVKLELTISQLVEQFSHVPNPLKQGVPEIWSQPEDISQRVARDALEHTSSQSAQLVRSSGKCQTEDELRNLQLQFKTSPPLSLYTGQKLGECGRPIAVALVDANTGNIVESGPESSVKLNVVVLQGGSKKDDDDNWTREEFERNVVKEREGKRPLLAGNLEVTLKGGTGVLGNLEFTDNSSWTWSKKFRMGLQVSPGYCQNIHICEAKTEAFTVKEHRGESYKKHYPPESVDEVWRLDNIAKDGPSHKKLNEAGIYTVEELLWQLFMDSKKLRNILGNGMTDKKWKVLLDHAQTCTLNGKLYVYYPDNESHHGVIFNNVGQLSGLTVDGVYLTADRFSPQQKVDADRLAKKACENWNDVREFNAEASSSSMSEKIPHPFPPEVLGGRCHPVSDNMTPPRLASQVGLAVPQEISVSTVEGNSGGGAARLPIQPQSLNSQNATRNPIIDGLNQMEPSASTYVQPSGCFPGNGGITSAGLPIQLQSLNSQNATQNQIFYSLNQTEPSANTNIQPYGQLYGPSSSFLAPNTEDEEYWELYSNLVAADQVSFAPG